MFTGIVEETGAIRSIKRGGNSFVVEIECDRVLEGTKDGDSIAVNGVCLTVTSLKKDSFTADVMPETLKRSSLSSAASGTKVNLERAMAADGRFGGHIVSGHIDGTGVITEIREDGNAFWYTIGCDSDILRYIVEKGSVTIDGISLTVAYVDENVFRVSVIPHTRKITSLGGKKAGDTVNIENDIIGKYVEKLMKQGETKEESGITEEFLIKYGF